MRVKSILALFNHRLVLAVGVLLVAVAVFFVTSSFTKNSDRSPHTTQTNLRIRDIGHRLLLQAGDATSRVLAVQEVNDGTFRLQFESALAFAHDSLIALTQAALPIAEYPSGYTVTVSECNRQQIVFGFQVNVDSSSLLPCQGRSEPAGCYLIEVQFPDMAEATFNYPLLSGIGVGALTLLSVVLIGRLRRNTRSESQISVGSAQMGAQMEHAASLGKFTLDHKQQRLLINQEVTKLTDKEYGILCLLNENFGQLVSRDVLIQQIWINEGVITGRSLDMFISKLRKKLTADSSLQIANVHGKGYKLELTE